MILKRECENMKKKIYLQPEMKITPMSHNRRICVTSPSFEPSSGFEDYDSEEDI